MGEGLKRAFAATRATRKDDKMAKKTVDAPKPTRKVKDKGAAATKAAMTPVPLKSTGSGAEIIPMNAGGPALAAQATPAAVSLVEIARQWADAKRMEAQGKREADTKRGEILKTFETPEMAIGFSNDFVDIKCDTEIDWTDPKLTVFLKEKGWFETLCKSPALNPDLVKSKALTEPDLAVLIKSLENRKPKFFQVKDKKEDKA